MKTPTVDQRRKALRKEFYVQYPDPDCKDMVDFLVFTVFPHSQKPPLKFLQGLDPEDAKELLEKVVDADHDLITPISHKNKMDRMKREYSEWLKKQGSTTFETPYTCLLNSCVAALKLSDQEKVCVSLPKDAEKKHRKSPLRKKKLKFSKKK